MKKKNLYSILLGMTLVACLTGCKSDETTDAKPAKELVMMGDKEIVIAASETGTSVAVTADCYWEITVFITDLTVVPWDDLTVSPRSGEGNGTIVFTSEKNKTSVERYAIIVISTKGGLKQVVEVHQSKSDAALSLNQEEFSFDAMGGLANLVVSSNTNWEIKGAEGIDWLEFSNTSGGAGTDGVPFQVMRAADELDRSANLTVVAGDSELQFNINQKGVSSISLALSPTDPAIFPATSGTQMITVNCNAAWYVTVPTSSSWIQVEPMMGLGDGEIRVTYTDNPSVREERQAYFIVTSGAKTVQQVDVHVKQEPAEEVIIPEEPHNIDPSLSR